VKVYFHPKKKHLRETRPNTRKYFSTKQDLKGRALKPKRRGRYTLFDAMSELQQPMIRGKGEPVACRSRTRALGRTVSVGPLDSSQPAAHSCLYSPRAATASSPPAAGRCAPSHVQRRSCAAPWTTRRSSDPSAETPRSSARYGSGTPLLTISPHGLTSVLRQAKCQVLRHFQYVRPSLAR
jgi:hypothetical protein